jgi:hypothetical protein
MPKPLANTAFLPLLLLLPVLALFGSCLALETRPTYIDTGWYYYDSGYYYGDTSFTGTETDPDPDPDPDPDTDTDTDTDTDGVCDESNSCDDCIECSFESPECGATWNRCLNSQSCIDFNDCLSDCNNSESCINQCIDWYPSGASLYLDLYFCIHCDACPTACNVLPMNQCP